MSRTCKLVEGWDLTQDVLDLDSAAEYTRDNANWFAGQTVVQVAGNGFSIANGTRSEAQTFTIHKAGLGSQGIFVAALAVRPFAALSGGDSKLISFRNEVDGVEHVYIDSLSDGKLEAKRGDDTSLGAASGVVLTDDEWTYLEILVSISDTVGVVIVRVDGVTTALNLSALDTKNGGSLSEIDSLRFHGGFYIDDCAFFSATTALIAELPGPGTVIARRPDSDTSVQFTRSGGSTNEENVDEINPDDDTTYNESSTVGHKDQMDKPDITDTDAILGVSMTVRAKKNDAAARDMRIGWTISATDFESDSKSLITDYKNFVFTWDADPSDSNPWTNVKLNAADMFYNIFA